MTRIDLARVDDIPAGAGVILQVVFGTSTTLDQTTSSSLVDSSLSATITPIADDSILLVSVDGTIQTSFAAGNHTTRHSKVAIRNDTDGVTLTEQLRGRTLIGNSTAGAASLFGIALRATYTVDSLTPRTFKLQFASGVATNATAIIRGDTDGPILMTIMEIAA